MKPAFECRETKPRRSDLRLRIPGRLAAAERTGPEQGVERPLERSEGRVRGANVFPEAKLTARHEHSTQFSERGGGIGHGAEDAHDDGGVEAAVLGRQGRGIAVDDVDADARRPCPLHGRSARRGIGLDGQRALDLARVVLERAPVAAADLDDAAAQSGERLPTELPVNGIGVAELALLEVAGEARLLRTVERLAGRDRGLRGLRGARPHQLKSMLSLGKHKFLEGIEGLPERSEPLASRP
jgi:hypothetical protein